MTSQETTKTPPRADEILRQFRSPLLRCCRCALLCFFQFVKVIRRVKWNAVGIENFDSIDSPVIFASNHQSHVDTHVILDVLPKSLQHTTAVAAAFDHFADADGTSMRKRLVQFFVAAVWHAFGIERVNSPLGSLRTMQELLARDWSIVIYPEGTRSRTGDIGTFKPGLALIAKKSKRPVIPVYVQGGRDVLPEATYIPHAGTIRVYFGEPLHFKENERSNEFMARVETAVREMANQT